MDGIEREVDNLGRVVLPVDFRNKLGLKKRDRLLVRIDGDSIVLTPTARRCALCATEINDGSELRLCDSCISRVKNNG